MLEAQPSHAERIKVFISYSRQDGVEFVDRVEPELERGGFTPLIDRHQIADLEEWKQRLEHLIVQADAIVFVITPKAVDSPHCGWEVRKAKELHKRLAPVLWRPVADNAVPEELGQIQRIPFDAPHEFDAALQRLLRALSGAPAWERRHAELLEQGWRWQGAGTDSERDSALLRGARLEAAERWIAERPPGTTAPLPLHRNYIAASRAAEAERLLREQEQVARTRKAQRRTAWVLALSAIGVVVGLWGVFAFWREVMLNRAQFIAGLAADQMENNPLTAMLLALEALPDRASTSLAQRFMPREVTAQHELDRAWRNMTSNAWYEHRQLSGHTDRVTAVAISPDGRLILTGSKDKTARLWASATGTQVAVLSGHTGPVNAVAFSPDGKLVVTGSDDLTARLWEAATGKSVVTLAGEASAVAFSPDGQIVATSSDDPEVLRTRLWDSRTGKLIRLLAGQFVSEPFARDSRSVVTFSDAGEAFVWEIPSGRGIVSPFLDNNSTYPIAFSPNGRLVLVGSRDGTARLREVATGKAVVTLSGVSGKVAVFSNDGRMLLTTGRPTLWDTATGSEIGNLYGHTNTVDVVAFSRDARTALTGSEDRVRLWETKMGRSVAALPSGGTSSTAVAFSPDGSRLVTGSADGAARIWESTRKVVVSLSKPALSEHIVAFSPDGRLVASLSHEGGPRLWDATRGEVVVTLSEHGEPVTTMAFSPKGKLVLTGSDDGTARLWETATGKSVATFAGHKAWVGAVAVSPDGKLVLTGSGDGSGNGTAHLWQAVDGKPVATLTGFPGHVSAVAFSPDGKRLLAGSWDAGSRLSWGIWDANGKANSPIYWISGKGTQARAVAFSPNGRLLASGSEEGSRLWDAATGKLVATLPKQTFGVSAVAFSPDGRLFASASRQGGGTLLWDLANNKLAATLFAKEGGAVAVAFSPDSRLVATASMTVTEVWEIETGKLIATLRGGETVVFSPDGRSLATNAWVWPILASTQELVTTAKSLVTRCLTPAQRTQFHLSSPPPRWCYQRRLWPYEDPAKAPPPPLAWDERLLANWEWAMGQTALRSTATGP